VTDRDRQNGPGGPGERAGERAEDDLLALLYGELDGEAEAAARARVEGDPAAAEELAGMERVRGMFRDLPDEEPPSRIDAQLLAEAARSVPGGKRAAAAAAGGEAAEGGFWARLVSWLQPMVARPAFAAAASLVLVAGVAGVLYVRKGAQLTDTSAHRAEPAADEAPAADPPPAAAGAAAELEADLVDPADAPAEGAAAPATPAPQPEAEPRGGAARPGDRKEEASARRRPAREKAREEKAKLRTKAARGGAGADPAAGKGALGSGAVYGFSEQSIAPPADQDGEAGAPARDAESAPASPGAPPPSAPAPAPTVGAAPPGQKPAPSARDLHLRAVDAALDRRCGEVRQLDRRVRETDAAYHRKVFLADQRLADCLGEKTKLPAKK